MASNHAHGPMKRWRALLGLAVAAVALGAGAAAVAATQGGSPSADRLRDVEQTRLHALVEADTTTAGDLTAPDFELVTPDGTTLTREDYLDAIGSGAVDYRVFEPVSAIQVRLSGDSAALRYRVSLDLTVGDSHLAHQGWVTELYEHRDGGWQIVWEQATAIPHDDNLFLRSIETVAAPDGG
jgi:ketosteroid isomerase-like protein